jgi:hypothetical protein
MGHGKRRVAGWLETAPPTVFALYAMTAAFSAYFCMYAFRKPFAAATFAHLHFLGTRVDLKTALVISQIIGYTVSKYLGIKVCSEATPQRRAYLLVGLVLASEAALFLFAVLPTDAGVIALFLNGLPLGMIWGLVVWYLEGRRSSDMLLSGLSCSFIVASGAVKDVGRYLMNAWKVSEAWMPFATGLIFLPPFLLAVWLLNQLPPPTPADAAARVERRPMDRAQRFAFARRFLLGLSMLLVVYLFLTAYRDFRDNFAVELYDQLGYRQALTVLTRAELVVAFVVMGGMALLNLFRDNRAGLIGTYALMTTGLVVAGLSTWLLDRGWLSGFGWMVGIGLGSYLAYVPYNSVLFDRLIAYTRTTGTAVFAIYLADALGYTGSVGVQLYRDLAQSSLSRLEFFRLFSYVLSFLGVPLLLVSCLYFLTRGQASSRSPRPIASTP